MLVRFLLVRRFIRRFFDFRRIIIYLLFKEFDVMQNEVNIILLIVLRIIVNQKGLCVHDSSQMVKDCLKWQEGILSI